MLCRDIGMLLLAMINGRLQVSDSFCGMGIGLGHFSRLGVSERGLGMFYKHVRMALLAMINGFLRITDGLGQMILG